MWLQPEQDDLWAAVRQQGRSRFIWRVFLVRYVLLGMAIWLLCMAVAQGITAAVTHEGWSSWVWQMARYALGVLITTPLTAGFLGRVFWRNAEVEWLERRNAQRDR